MADLTKACVSVLVSLGYLTVVAAGEYCTTSPASGFSSFSSTTYCRYDCCGDYPYEYCCAGTSIAAGAIIGIIFGVIFCITLLIALICCCVRSQGSRGQVMRSPGVANATVVTTNTSSQYPGPTYGQPAGQTYQYPTAYGQPMGGVAPGQYPSNAYSQPMGGVAPGPYPSNAYNPPMAAPPPSYDSLHGPQQPYDYGQGNPAFNPTQPDPGHATANKS